MNLIILCLLLGASLALAAKKDDLSKQPKNPRARGGIELMSDEISTKGKDKVKDPKGNGLKKKGEKTDRNGNKITRMQQEYDDLEVLGYEIIDQQTPEKQIMEMDKSTGKPTGRKIKLKKQKKLRGKFAMDLDQDLGTIDKGKLNPNKALNKLKQNRGQGAETSHEEAKSVVYVNEASGKGQVAYKVGFFRGGSNPGRPTALYDENDNLIAEWDDLQFQSIQQLGTGPGGNLKTGKYQYGTSEDNLAVTKTASGKCQLLTDQVKVVNLEQSWDINRNDVFEYGCYEQASDEINGGYSALNDAQHFGKEVFDMYSEWYETAPLTSDTMPLTLKVHYGSNLQNAYWFPSAGYMAFGDGADSFHPLLSLDVVAHEVSHGVTTQSSNLVYSGQSGGLNEAFSDMAGKAVERFSRGYNKDTFQWGVGYDIVKSQSGKLRCMDNPPCDGVSIDHVSKFSEGMDVHHSSGVFNKVFYLLAATFKYDLWDAFDLFYVANTKFWQSSTNFAEAAELTLTALDEMHECIHLPMCYGWIDDADVTAAFKQVGISCSKVGKRKNAHWVCA